MEVSCVTNEVMLLQSQTTFGDKSSHFLHQLATLDLFLDGPGWTLKTSIYYLMMKLIYVQ